MTQDKVSVIVPVYNSEQYISQCLDSILSQTYRNIEIILVDDGSSDKSGAICDKYEKIDNRIRVFHKINGGASTARNLGLDMADGEYVMFVDSDDYIDEDMVTALYKAINSADVDIVGSYFKYLNGRAVAKDSRNHYKKIELTSSDALRMLLLRKIDCSPCLKLYRRSIIGNLRFPEGVTNEDFVFLFRLYNNVRGISFVPVAYYYYRYNPNSVTHTLSIHSFDIMKNVLMIEKEIHQDDSLSTKGISDEFFVYKNKIALDCCFLIISNNKLHEYKEIYKEAKKICIPNVWRILSNRNFSIKYKIKLILTIIFI